MHNKISIPTGFIKNLKSKVFLIWF